MSSAPASEVPHVAMPSPAPYTASVGGDITADVDSIVRDYFSTLSAKDEDIFRLYEDNKRIRDVAEQSLKHRAELETRLASQNLLVEALRTELNEKAHLIAAQEAESGMLRDGAAALRAVLGQPSTDLTVTLADVVDETRQLMQDRVLLGEALDVLASGAQDMSAAYEAFLLREERRARRALEDAALFPFSSPFFTERQRTLERLCTQAEKELALTRAEAAQGLADLQEQHQLEAHHASLQAGRTTRALVEAERRHKTSLIAAEQRELQDGEQLRRQMIELASLTALLPALAARCAAAEKQWAALSAQRSDQQEIVRRGRERVVQLEDEVAQERAALARERDIAAKLRRQHDKDEALKKELEVCHVRLASHSRELDEMKAKNVALCQKLVTQRQQQTATVKDLRANVAALQAREEELQRRHTHLQDRTTTLQEEGKLNAKRLQTLERKREEATEASRAAETVHQQQLKDATERHEAERERAVAEAEQRCLALFDEERKALQDAHKASEETRQQAHQDELARLVETHETERSTQARNFQLEKSALTREIEEWIVLVDGLRDELRVAQSQLAAEHAARATLECQRQTESEMLERMKQQQAERTGREQDDRVKGAEHGARAGHQDAADDLLPSLLGTLAGHHQHSSQQSTEQLTEECAALKRQVRVLEQACRRSAAVITELREAQHGVSLPSPRQEPPPRAANRSRLARQSAPPSQLQQTSMSMLSALIADLGRDD